LTHSSADQAKGGADSEESNQSSNPLRKDVQILGADDQVEIIRNLDAAQQPERLRAKKSGAMPTSWPSRSALTRQSWASGGHSPAAARLPPGGKVFVAQKRGVCHALGQQAHSTPRQEYRQKKYVV
jgi:hypothetical protein